MNVKVLKSGRTLIKRYCEMCDTWISEKYTNCPLCGAPTIRASVAIKKEGTA